MPPAHMPENLLPNDLLPATHCWAGKQAPWGWGGALEDEHLPRAGPSPAPMLSTSQESPECPGHINCGRSSPSRWITKRTWSCAEHNRAGGGGECLQATELVVVGLGALTWCGRRRWAGPVDQPAPEAA